jgi:6-pyruvoyl-tetrahydropterin synthase
MFAVEVRDHIMIAHSLPAPAFGPAQAMHGATFVVDAAFFAESLDAHGIVVDIGLATEALGKALEPLRYRNLDEVPDFAGKLTTTEFLCREIWTHLAQAARSGGLNDAGRVRRIRVTLHESHVARAWYEAEVGSA